MSSSSRSADAGVSVETQGFALSFGLQAVTRGSFLSFEPAGAQELQPTRARSLPALRPGAREPSLEPRKTLEASLQFRRGSRLPSRTESTVSDVSRSSSGPVSACGSEGTDVDGKASGDATPGSAEADSEASRSTSGALSARSSEEGSAAAGEGPAEAEFPHERGRCKPCFYNLYGACSFADSCRYCHMPHMTTKWRRPRPPPHVRSKLKAVGVSLFVGDRRPGDDVRAR